MISKRCQGRNLLNHLNKKNVEYDLNFEQIMEKSSPEYYHWKCTFTFDGKTYSIVNQKKNNAVEFLLNEAEDAIFNYLR